MSKKLTAAFIIFAIILISYFFCNQSVNTHVPVLVYHIVSDDIFSKNTSLFVSPAEFEKQMQWIVKNKYTTIFANSTCTDEKYEKPIMITFDDGYEDNYKTVFPLIKKYNIKITIFVVTDGIGTARKLNSNQIIDMYDSGLVSFQSHTKSHANLLKINSQQLDTELRESKDKLFFITNEFPTAIAYPYGKVSPAILNSVKKYYTRGYSVLSGNLSYTDDNYMIRRFGIGRYTTVDDIKMYLYNV